VSAHLRMAAHVHVHADFKASLMGRSGARDVDVGRDPGFRSYDLRFGIWDDYRHGDAVVSDRRWKVRIQLVINTPLPRQVGT
jgi:hypothetical protein